MEPNEETVVADIESEVESHDEATEEEKDTTDWKAKHDELAGRLKRAETKLEKSKIDKKVEEKIQQKAGELSESQLDYLDLKGVTEDEDLAVIERYVRNTGETPKQALKDEYVISKLTANKAKRDVQAATPSSTKRAGGQVGDVASATAKFKETGVLPEDRALADAVVDSIAKAGNDRLPPWQR